MLGEFFVISLFRTTTVSTLILSPMSSIHRKIVPKRSTSLKYGVDFVLKTQNWLISVSPGLMPLMALVYSMVNSWHCSVMCGSLATTENRKQLHQFLLFRLISYTLMGAVFGFAGKTLRNSLEFEFFNVLGFTIFVAITVVFVLPQLLPFLPKFSIYQILRPRWSSPMSASFRGALLALMPCHLLVFYYGVAALTGSPFLGGMLLLGHAAMTTPALAYAQHFVRHFKNASWMTQGLLRILLLGLILLNLFYFGGRLLHPTEDIHHRLLFCL